MIVRMLFGSHLYGTNTPSSDTDYKGVAMPTVRDIALGRITPHIVNKSTGSQATRNTYADVDEEIFSLHKFISLALAGQTVAVDMLHAPEKMILETSDIWKFIQANRSKFYSKNVKPLMGYALKQAAKYGVKGSRVNALDTIIKFLESQDQSCPLSGVLDNFPFMEHVKYLPSPDETKELPMIEVCGKKFHLTCSCGYVCAILKKVYTVYGTRALQAANNEGVDWKAVSHAFRAAYQVKELFEKGTITFPRPEAKFLIKVKTGQLDFKEGLEKLETLLEEVSALEFKVDLPDEPDKVFWENVLFDLVCRKFKK